MGRESTAPQIHVVSRTPPLRPRPCASSASAPRWPGVTHRALPASPSPPAGDDPTPFDRRRRHRERQRKGRPNPSRPAPAQHLRTPGPPGDPGPCRTPGPLANGCRTAGARWGRPTRTGPEPGATGRWAQYGGRGGGAAPTGRTGTGPEPGAIRRWPPTMREHLPRTGAPGPSRRRRTATCPTRRTGTRQGPGPPASGRHSTEGGGAAPTPTSTCPTRQAGTRQDPGPPAGGRRRCGSTCPTGRTGTRPEPGATRSGRHSTRGGGIAPTPTSTRPTERTGTGPEPGATRRWPPLGGRGRGRRGGVLDTTCICGAVDFRLTPRSTAAAP